MKITKKNYIYKNSFIEKIPFYAKNVYFRYKKAYTLCYNPNSYKGVILLDKKNNFLLKKINGKNKIKDILSLAEAINTIKEKEALRLIRLLINYHIISLDKNELNKFFFKKEKRILSVWFHITNQCNFRCKYCFVEKTNENMKYKTAELSIKKLLLSAKKHNFEGAHFKFAGGEPLLEINKIIDLVRKAKHIGKKIKIETKFMCITNGSLLTEKIASLLKQNDISVNISIDGLGKIQDKTRVFRNGLGTSSYVLRGINLVRRLNILRGFSITVTVENIRHLPDLIKFLLITKKIDAALVINFYKNHTKQEIDLTADDNNMFFYLKKTLKIIYGETNTIKSFIPSKRTIFDSVEFFRPSLTHCGAGYSYISIMQDGSIRICPSTTKNAGTVYSSTDIIEQMRKKNFLFITTDKIDKCYNCQWMAVCRGGCRLQKLNLYGRIDTPSPYCNVYKKIIPFIIELEGQRLFNFILKRYI